MKKRAIRNKSVSGGDEDSIALFGITVSDREELDTAEIYEPLSDRQRKRFFKEDSN